MRLIDPSDPIRSIDPIDPVDPIDRMDPIDPNQLDQLSWIDWRINWINLREKYRPFVDYLKLKIWHVFFIPKDVCVINF